MTSADGSAVVYFAREDYAGFWRRLAVEVVDILVALGLLVALAFLFTVTPHRGRVSVELVFLAWGVVTFWYFVILKHLGWRTAGYHLGGVRIVDACGQVPGFTSLSLRLLFGVMGPFNVLVDMLWIPSDPWRQSLRDKLAHTYVVKANAKPAGPGRLVYRNYHMLGSTFIFQEIQPGKVADAP